MDQTSVLFKDEVSLGIFKQMAYGPWWPATRVSTFGGSYWSTYLAYRVSLFLFLFFSTYFAKSSKSVAKDSEIKYQREYL